MTTPVLPFAPTEYSREYFNEYNRILTLYFRQVQSGGALRGTVLNLSGLPTSATGLRSGDVWVDSAASHVLKLVP
jgi:hypothetical protein